MKVWFYWLLGHVGQWRDACLVQASRQFLWDILQEHAPGHPRCECSKSTPPVLAATVHAEEQRQERRVHAGPQSGLGSAASNFTKLLKDLSSQARHPSCICLPMEGFGMCLKGWDMDSS